MGVARKCPGLASLQMCANVTFVFCHWVRILLIGLRSDGDIYDACHFFSPCSGFVWLVSMFVSHNFCSSAPAFGPPVPSWAQVGLQLEAGLGWFDGVGVWWWIFMDFPWWHVLRHFRKISKGIQDLSIESLASYLGPPSVPLLPWQVRIATQWKLEASWQTASSGKPMGLSVTQTSLQKKRFRIIEVNVYQLIIREEGPEGQKSRVLWSFMTFDAFKTGPFPKCSISFA